MVQEVLAPVAQNQTHLNRCFKASSILGEVGQERPNNKARLLKVVLRHTIDGSEADIYPVDHYILWRTKLCTCSC